MTLPILYGYWRSSAAYRVRIALEYKGIAVEHRPINIKPGIDAQLSDDFLTLNPEGRVPFFVDEGVTLSQSMAILEYLEERYPIPTLLPGSMGQKARIRQICALMTSDIHPLNNLSVLRYLKETLGQTEETVNDWYTHWILRGFAALEQQLEGAHWKGPYLMGDKVTLADVCLVPQIWNARRFDVDLKSVPSLVAIDEALNALPAFQAARPDKQPDALHQG